MTGVECRDARQVNVLSVRAGCGSAVPHTVTVGNGQPGSQGHAKLDTQRFGRKSSWHRSCDRSELLLVFGRAPPPGENVLQSGLGDRSYGPISKPFASENKTQ